MTQMRIAYSIINHLLFNLKEEYASFKKDFASSGKHSYLMENETKHKAYRYISPHYAKLENLNRKPAQF